METRISNEEAIKGEEESRRLAEWEENLLAEMLNQHNGLDLLVIKESLLLIPGADRAVFEEPLSIGH